ncbi:hypothetical protein SETIT_2G310500v2 [Setaria italica]|uniref:Uncharacterized protein n=1 Tax=Setaria italica TaxID=4555 RepID=A0A368Q557_SETIT|nr:hypothetical protein SETIT_2G310500v2 [Setaria italica]
MKYGDPALILGAAHRSPDHVTVCVSRSVAVREEERCLSLTALIGVHVNGRAKLSGEVVSASAAKLMYPNIFNAPTFIEEIDTEHETEQERDCLCLWVWTANPDGLAKTVSLQVVEPLTFPEEYYWKMGEMDLPTAKTGPAEMLEHAVTIHLDRILDYLPLPSSPSHESVHNGISGLPDDLYEEEWPIKHRFVWHYGVPDDCVVRRQVPVQERLVG